MTEHILNDSTAPDNHLEVDSGPADPVEGEIVVKMENGLTLRSGSMSHQAGSYVRICDANGDEIHYWDYAEWQEDPVTVMGAIVAAAGGAIVVKPLDEEQEPRKLVKVKFQFETEYVCYADNGGMIDAAIDMILENVYDLKHIGDEDITVEDAPDKTEDDIEESLLFWEEDADE